MEILKLPMGRALTLDWPEPAGVVFAFVADGVLWGVRRTHPEEEPDSWLEQQAAQLPRRATAKGAGHRRRLDIRGDSRSN